MRECHPKHVLLSAPSVSLSIDLIDHRFSHHHIWHAAPLSSQDISDIGMVAVFFVDILGSACKTKPNLYLFMPNIHIYIVSLLLFTQFL